MVVMVSRRSSVDWPRLSLHFDDEVRPVDSELERGGLDRGFVGDVGVGRWRRVRDGWGETVGATGGRAV
jgi:hypothetical protein